MIYRVKCLFSFPFTLPSLPSTPHLLFSFNLTNAHTHTLSHHHKAATITLSEVNLRDVSGKLWPKNRQFPSDTRV